MTTTTDQTGKRAKRQYIKQKIGYWTEDIRSDMFAFHSFPIPVVFGFRNQIFAFDDVFFSCRSPIPLAGICFIAISFYQTALHFDRFPFGWNWHSFEGERFEGGFRYRTIVSLCEKAMESIPFALNQESTTSTPIFLMQSHHAECASKRMPSSSI